MFADDWLKKRAELTPDKVAVVDTVTGARHTYRDMQARALRLAAFLQREAGVKKGDRVAVLAVNRIEHLDVLFAAQKIGAVLVPLNHRLAPGELAQIVQDCRPGVLIYDTGNTEAATQFKKMVAAKVCVSLEEKRPEGDDVPYREIMSVQAGVLAPVETELEDPWLILYTGGTTGFPKGAVLSRRMVTWNAVNTAVSWDLTHVDVAPVFTPFFHTGGLNVLTTPLIHLGGTLILPGPFKPGAALDMIQRERCTIVFMVPAMFQMIMQLPEFPETDFSSVRFCISGGAPCPLPVYEAYRSKGVVFKQGYGLTEAGPNCFSLPAGDTIRKTGSVGRPVFHGEVKLVDGEGREVGVDRVGELIIRGNHLFSGYWNNPRATTEALRDGWLYTGDLVRRDGEGFYYIVDRKKEMIISGGENIYPVEVEAVLYSHPKVAEAAVVGVPDEKWGEVPKAVVVLRRGEQMDADELIRFCRERLAAYKAPKLVEFASGLPKSAAGKILKRELKGVG